MLNLYHKIINPVWMILFILSFQASFAAFENASEGADAPVCKTNANMMTNNGSCRTTPNTYEIAVFEMGLCTSHPFTNDGTKTDISTMDKSTCSTTFLASDQTNGSVLDIANVIGGSVDLVGTSTRPPNGTYGFPYIILREKFVVGISIVGNDGNTYNGNANGNTVAGGTLVNYDDNLRNFTGGQNKCLSGYVGATIPIGTIDAFLTDTNLVRSESTGAGHYDAGNDRCAKFGKLVGIINLTTPFTINQDTIKMQFNFVVSDYGIHMTDTNNDGYPDAYGSAPFSGTFTLTTAPQQ